MPRGSIQAALSHDVQDRFQAIGGDFHVSASVHDTCARVHQIDTIFQRRVDGVLKRHGKFGQFHQLGSQTRLQDSQVLNDLHQIFASVLDATQNCLTLFQCHIGFVKLTFPCVDLLGDFAIGVTNIGEEKGISLEIELTTTFRDSSHNRLSSRFGMMASTR